MQAAAAMRNTKSVVFGMQWYVRVLEAIAGWAMGGQYGME
jgi:hypothetical protein